MTAIQMIRSKLGHLFRYAFISEYRKRHQEYTRLLNYPGKTRGCTRILGKPFHFVDARCFHSQWHEIFCEKLLSFAPENDQILFLDLGAHVGLATSFVKTHFPYAEVIAYEADPDIAEVYSKNILTQAWTNVTLVSKAIWDKEGELTFSIDNIDSGHVVDSAEGKSMKISCEAISILFDRIGNRTIDLIKLDIEGAELTVLRSVKYRLNQVQKIFVEYHSRQGQVQTLAELLNIIQEAGFRYHIHNVMPSKIPFEKIEHNHGYDLLLNIHAWRK